jgi:hypothetical protein
MVKKDNLAEGSINRGFEPFEYENSTAGMI